MGEKMTHERILHNINSFIEHQGLRKERLAKKMGKQPSTFYATLQGKHPNSVYKFAVELAEMLGYKGTYFIDEDFALPVESQPINMFAFSVGSVSDTVREGFEQLERICELIRIYDSKGGEGYAGTHQ